MTESLYDYKNVSFIKKNGTISRKSIQFSAFVADLEKVQANYTRENMIIEKLIKKMSVSSNIEIDFSDKNYTKVLFLNHGKVVDQMRIIRYDYNVINMLKLYSRV